MPRKAIVVSTSINTYVGAHKILFADTNNSIVMASVAQTTHYRHFSLRCMPIVIHNIPYVFIVVENLILEQSRQNKIVSSNAFLMEVINIFDILRDHNA